MNYRMLGRTGVKIAPLGIGTLNFGYATVATEAERILARALDAGLNLIDTANSYNDGASERMLGELIARNGWRDRVVLATKAHFPVGAGPNDRGNSRLHLISALGDRVVAQQDDIKAGLRLQHPNQVGFGHGRQ